MSDDIILGNIIVSRAEFLAAKGPDQALTYDVEPTSRTGVAPAVQRDYGVIAKTTLVHSVLLRPRRSHMTFERVA